LAVLPLEPLDLALVEPRALLELLDPPGELGRLALGRALELLAEPGGLRLELAGALLELLRAVDRLGVVEERLEPGEARTERARVAGVAGSVDRGREAHTLDARRRDGADSGLSGARVLRLELLHAF